MKRVILALVLVIPLNLGYGTYTSKRWFKDDLICLSDNIHYEARGEPEEGKRLVARTVLNRLQSPKFKWDTICRVVYAPNQYSWTKQKRKTAVAKHDDIMIAIEVLHEEDTGKVTHFHSAKVKPSWRNKLERFKQVGNHIFYHEKE